MNDIWPLLNNGVTQIAATLIGLGVIWRYVVAPLWRVFRAFLRRAKALTAEVEEVRAAVAKVHEIVSSELTPNGGGSAKDQLTHLVNNVAAHDKRLQVLNELITAHLADDELKDHHLVEQLAAQGVEIDPLQPRERWRWINNKRPDPHDT